MPNTESVQARSCRATSTTDAGFVVGRSFFAAAASGDRTRRLPGVFLVAAMAGVQGRRRGSVFSGCWLRRLRDQLAGRQASPASENPARVRRRISL
jgi:hypothetical protein